MTYKEFLKHVKENPFIGNQEQCGTGNNYWNADYWTIEVARCLSSDEYILPVRFKGNKFADPNRIKKDADIKRAIKTVLESIKDSADCLLVCEVGRGLDILVANTVKEWKTVYCYDHVNYERYLKRVFNNISFLQKGTGVYMTDLIEDECIVIMNHSIYSYEKFMNTTHGIINGELKW